MGWSFSRKKITAGVENIGNPGGSLKPILRYPGQSILDQIDSLNSNLFFLKKPLSQRKLISISYFTVNTSACRRVIKMKIH